MEAAAATATGSTRRTTTEEIENSNPDIIVHLNFALAAFIGFLAQRSISGLPTVNGVDDDGNPRLSIRPDLEVRLHLYSIAVTLSFLSMILHFVVFISNKWKPTPLFMELIFSFTAWAAVSFFIGEELRGDIYMRYSTLIMFALVVIIILYVDPEVILRLIVILLTPVRVVWQMIKSYVRWCKRFMQFY